ncbi:MAG TPA: PTS ascorbate transporter subunit IIC [Acidimicrobiia bacterium]|nr:PTS ascorbate transporter subunit IIC [Acidimicrobiia bacterium]
MDALKTTLQWFANNMFNEVAILIGLIVLAGLWLQHKKIEDIVAGAMRATIGIYVLQAGISVFVAGLSAFQTILASAFGLDPPKATGSMDNFLKAQGGTVAMVITVGFLAHILIVKLLHLRYVYLTGHLMFWMSFVVVASLVASWSTLTQLQLVLIGGAIVAVYWTVQPMYMASKMRRVTGNDEWGYAHTSSSNCYLAAAAGKHVGDAEKEDAEKIKLPARLSIFKDINVATGLVITAIMLVGMAFADNAVRVTQAAAYDPDVNPWVWGVIQSLKFAAGIAILLFGVRMFLAEVVPAFKGISDRVIPGARPALDCPTVFPSAPSSVMIGFLSATAVFLVLMAFFAAIDWIVIVPPMIMLFFPGGAAGVFGNKHGGWKAAILGGAITGAFLAVGQAVTWTLLSGTAPELATLADPDWYIMSWILLFIHHPLAWGTFEEAFVTVFGWLMVAGAVLAAGLAGRHGLDRRHQIPKAPAPQDRIPVRV